MINKYLIAFIYFLLFVNNGYCQDSVKAKKIKVLPVPALGYSPETKTYLGIVSLFTFDFYRDSVTRLSNAKLEFNYTWNDQWIFDTAWNIFSHKEEWFTKGQLHYSKFPDFYYGVGSNTLESKKIIYDSDRIILDAYALKKLKNKVFTGLNIKYIEYWNVKSSSVNSATYSELIDRSTFGFGYSVLHDSRNSLLTPTHGFFLNVNGTYNFSKTNYLELLFDLRYYKSYRRLNIALRLLNDLNLGTPAFYDYAYLGGDKNVRGYYHGRYRDKNLHSLQVEFRHPIIWRIGLATFGGVSTLYSALGSLKLKDVKSNEGLGIRFIVDKTEKTSLRLDYAFGERPNRGFYISFGESF